jgi:transposase-like protein
MQDLAGLSSEARELALTRFRLLQPHLERGCELRSVAAQAEVSFRTLQRWVAQYRRSGLVALARKARGDQGGRRTVSSQIKEAIERLALERPPLPVTSIYRQVCSSRRPRARPPRATGSFATLWASCRESSHACASGRQGVQREFRPGTPRAALFSAHITRPAAGDLAQGRPALAHLRHTGGALHRQRIGFHIAAR